MSHAKNEVLHPASGWRVLRPFRYLRLYLSDVGAVSAYDKQSLPRLCGLPPSYILLLGFNRLRTSVLPQDAPVSYAGQSVQSHTCCSRPEPQGLLGMPSEGSLLEQWKQSGGYD